MVPSVRRFITDREQQATGRQWLLVWGFVTAVTFLLVSLLAALDIRTVAVSLLGGTFVTALFGFLWTARIAFRQRDVFRPALFALLGGLSILSTWFTYRGACAPVGDYDGPSGIRSLTLESGQPVAAYGNGCTAQVSLLPLGIGAVLLLVGGVVWWGRR